MLTIKGGHLLFNLCYHKLAFSNFGLIYAVGTINPLSTFYLMTCTFHGSSMHGNLITDVN